ncbi:hypothetical protein [Neisseria arctica]|uniref:hypothetical protein n=1 Tax=Neisseria arctica TaxID=1470200 RepID=UPI00069C852B|nr:hypothetical protein [Neisseria arctica]UOO87051.1 hypothetical protein LVJ86_02015 [Neisseria arctica]
MNTLNAGFELINEIFAQTQANKPQPRKYQGLPDCKITGEIYSLPLAAVLWCGVPIEESEAAIAESENMGKGIYRHPYIPCLEKKTRALYFAIQENKLRTCREHGDGGEGNDHVAYDRRHFWASDLKEFIEQYHPDDKPAFLFSDEERKPEIDLLEYQRMNAEYIKQQTEIVRLKTELAAAESKARDNEAAKLTADDRLEKAVQVYRENKAEIESLKEENKRLKNAIKQPSAKTTNKQNEIIAGLSVLFTKTDGAQPYEMAETILQEWQRNTKVLGSAPSKEAIAAYIKLGMERIKP